MSSFSLDDKKDQRRVLQALTQAKIQLKKLKGEMDPGKNKIAIISIGCRYPGGVENTNGLWKLLENQTDATSLYPENRWGKNLFRNSNNGSNDEIHAKKGGFLKNIKKFDAKFFGISGREALNLDPQQRLLLEVAWETFERGGILIDKKHPKNIGVFIGISSNEYSQKLTKSGLSKDIDIHFITGNTLNAAAGRISYVLGLKGPAMAIDTACSSSLVSVHVACQSLLAGDCESALAGGVNLLVSSESTLSLSKANVLSPDGACKTFDASADGMARAEGCGLILLKRLSDAQSNADNILGVIEGSAVNQDGPGAGLTVPNRMAQEDLMHCALRNSNLTPKDISYVEAHGTGTSLGDPIELKALQSVYGVSKTKDDPLIVGAVKANIGHTESASGVLGIIKTILCLQKKEIPGQIHFNKPTPHVNWDSFNLEIPKQNRKWTLPNKRSTRIAGVSAFGLSGTNGHLILSEYSESGKSKSTLDSADSGAPKAIDLGLPLLLVSAKNKRSVRSLLRTHLKILLSKSFETQEQEQEYLTRYCLSSQIFRNHFKTRVAISAFSKGKYSVEKICQGIKNTLDRDLISVARSVPKLAALCTGQGSSYAGMGQELYDNCPLFSEKIDTWEGSFNNLFKISLKDILFGKNAESLQKEAQYLQPALFALEISLYQFWSELGLDIHYCSGHSIGEYAASCIAKISNPEDVLPLVHKRGKLMDNLDGEGAMLVCMCSPKDIEQKIINKIPDIEIGLYNTPVNTVLSGPANLIDQAQTIADKQKIQNQKLSVTHAFHSRMLDPMVQPLIRQAKNIVYKKARIPMASNLTGKLIPKGETITAQYWGDHTRSAVRFSQGMDSLSKKGVTHFLELGPMPILIGMGRQCISDMTWMSSLNPRKDLKNNLSSTFSKLYISGFKIDFQKLFHKVSNSIIPDEYPVYKFDGKEYWTETDDIRDQRFQEKEKAQSFQSFSDSKNLSQSHNNQKTAPKLDIKYLESYLQRLIADLLGETLSDIDIKVPFLEMGADSIILMESLSYIKRDFGLEIKIRQIFEDLGTVAKLSRFILDQNPQTFPEDLNALNFNSMMGADDQARSDSKSILDKDLEPIASDSNTNSIAGFWETEEPDAVELTQQQSEYLNKFTIDYNKRTLKSKEMEILGRPKFSDMRTAIGFRIETKEMAYPIMAISSNGANFIDVDGNNYIDMCMGFGVNLFGHQPDFIRSALTNQIEKGIQIGPQSVQAHLVSEKICALTGMERVTFCNSGTEAVMTAIRLARSVTGLSRLVYFSGSYHGHSDATLGLMASLGKNPKTLPMAPGIPPEAVQNALVLPWGKKKSLEIIKNYANEIACVLVEPVQSRRPGVQPKAFLKELRQITLETETPLIFDEMITGFRIHPGGAQAWYGIKADICTYGKLLGGGMPIGVVAGQKRFLDRIDGGEWQYGDQSFPQTERTFYGGTFCKHPLAMAGALAVLTEMEKKGPELQKELNERTKNFTRSMNAMLSEYGTSMELVNFGSLMRFHFKENYSYMFQPLDMDLFCLHMIAKGIYIWEGKTLFLSTAHTEEDLNKILNAARESIEDLQSVGFINGPGSKIDFSKNGGDHSLTIPRTTKSKTYSLSIPQEHLLAQCVSSSDVSESYIESLKLEFSGKLDIQKLEYAWKKLIERHEVLRTVIDLYENKANVYSISDWANKFSESLSVDLVKESQWSQHVIFIQEQIIHFNTHLYYLIACQRTGDVWDIQMGIHHLVADGWSLGVLVTELGSLYHDLSSELPIAVSYSEYIQNRKKQNQQEEFSEQLDYWVNKFSKGVPLFIPPFHFNPISDIKVSGFRTIVPLDTKLVKSVENFSRGSQCTPFMIFLAAYALLLHRLSRQDTVLIHIPVSGRKGFESVPLAGYCTHMLPIISNYDADVNFSEWVVQFRETILDAFDNQDVSFAEVNEILALRYGIKTKDFLSATFNMDPEYDWSTWEKNGHVVKQKPVKVRSVPFPLSLHLVKRSGSWTLACDVLHSIFDLDQVERFLGYYQNFVSCLVCDTKEDLVKHIGQFEFMDQIEVKKILSDWSPTMLDIKKPHTVHGRIIGQLENMAKKKAVLIGEKWLTYNNIAQRSSLLAGNLLRKGFGPGKRAGILLNRNEDLIISLLAVMRTGTAFIPIDPIYPDARINYILENSGAQYLLVSSDFSTKRLENLLALLDKPIQLIDPVLDSEIIDKNNDQSKSMSSDIHEGICEPDVNSHDECYIIYTSGSTGYPKGIKVPHIAIVNFLDSMAKKPGMDSQDTLLALTTICFDISILELFLPLFTGAKMVLVDTKTAHNPLDLGNRINQTKSNIVQATPSTWKMLVDSGWKPDIPIKILCGGEAMSNQLAHSILQLNSDNAQVELWNMYGPTETTIWSSIYQIDSDDILYNDANIPSEKSVPIGNAIDNTHLYILDKKNNPVPIGVPGELVIGGIGVSNGYIGLPEINDQNFIFDTFQESNKSRMYRTGDLVRWNEKGLIEYLGRIDNQIKVRGFRIEPSEIEAHLLNLDHVTNVIVDVGKGEAGQQLLIAWVQSSSPNYADDCRSYLLEYLPIYMIPNKWISIQEIPLTLNGKLDRKRLPKPNFEDEDENRVTNGEKESIEPVGKTEEKMALLWKEVFGIQNINRKDSFIRLGGDSLLSTRVMTRIFKVWGIKIPLEIIFNAKSLEDLCLWLDNALADEKKVNTDSYNNIVELEI